MKYCENCGAELEDSAVFCEECGAKVETVPQEKAVDSEQSKEAEKQDNAEIDDAVIDTSNKPVGKELEDDAMFCEECGAKVEKKTIEQPTQTLNKSNRKRNKLVPILCTIIGILVVVIVIILLYGINKIKKNNDTDTQTNLSSDITEQTEFHSDITVPATESITEKQTELKFDAKTLNNKSWNSKFITKNGYTYCVSMRINSVQGDIAISELIIKCYKENSDSGFKDKLVNIPIKATDNKLEFDVSKADSYFTESGDLDETKEFKPLDSLKDNYKGVFQITFTSGNDNLTVVSGNIYCGKTYMDFSGASLEPSVH